jgi:hypothetical protein
MVTDICIVLNWEFEATFEPRCGETVKPIKKEI